MTVAYDAFGGSGTTGTGDISWTHTPVGTPRGIIVFVVQAAGGTDSVTGVTYGGVAMSEMSGSPNLKAASETGGVHAYFLGASIPTGAQTIAVATTGSVTKRGYSFSLTASDDTEVVDSDGTINSNSVSNPSVTLSLSSRDCFCALSFFTGVGNVFSITPLTDWTTRGEHAMGGLANSACYSYDIIDDVDVTAGWTQGADDAVAICVAVAQVAPSAATAYTFTGPTSGTVNVASTNFTVTPNGTSTATVTPATDGSGSFTPATVQFDGTAAAKTFTYTPTDVAGSPHTLSTSDDGGLTETSGTIDYTVNDAGNRRRRVIMGAAA